MSQNGGRARRRVLITGLGAVTPLGVSARALLGQWVAGRSGLEPGVGACAEFDPGEVLSTKEVRRTSRFAQLAIAATAEAVADAGWDADGPPCDPRLAGCVIGSAMGGVSTFEDAASAMMLHGPRRVSALSIPLGMGNAACGMVAMRHGLRGPVFGVMSACASGAHAIGTAFRMVAAGDADVVIAGGAEATLTPLVRAAFAAMNATSVLGVSRPFDARRDGFLMGEGAAMLVLESDEFAVGRGARVLGEVLGYAATCDAHHLTAPDPSGEALAITRALDDAGLSAADVAYVNAHGTSTVLNDRSETDALKLALGAESARIPVSSTKSAIGHLLGAAGAVEAVATVLALGDGVAPPTLGYEEPDEGLDLDYVPGAAKALRVTGERAVGLSNSFAFGGHNAVLCLAGAA